jgi:hypothetical protein
MTDSDSVKATRANVQIDSIGHNRLGELRSRSCRKRSNTLTAMFSAVKHRFNFIC